MTMLIGFVSALCQGKLILPPTCPRYKQSVLMEYEGVTKAKADESALKVSKANDASIESEDEGSMDGSISSMPSEATEVTNYSFGSSASIHDGESASPPSVILARAKKQKVSPAEAALAKLWACFSMKCNGQIKVDYGEEPKKRTQK